MFAFQFVHHVYSFTYNTAFGTHFFIKFLLKHTEKLDKGIMISGVLGVLLFLAIGVIGSLIIAQNVSLIRGRKMMK
jgi:heme A synthase